MDNIFKNHFYINLDKRVDRRIEVEKELLKLGITNPRRMKAIHNKNGVLGCALSHIKCIEEAKTLDLPYVVIFEDDLEIKDEDLLKSKVIKLMDMPEWDILLLAGNNFHPYTEYDDYIKVSRCYTTGAYIVRKHYYDKYLTNLREGVEQLIRTNRRNEFSLDVYSHKLQREDNWFLIIPICAGQKQDYSDIENSVVDYSYLMYNYNKQ